jgi:hypothetical protein
MDGFDDQNTRERENIVGLSMKGGKRDQFFFCLLEFFPDEKRWFLKSLLQVKDEEGLSGDEAIRSWIDEYEVKQLVLDIPLSEAACANCLLDCPGSNQCPEPGVVEVRRRMEEILKIDKEFEKKNPKKYEQDRNRDDLYDYGRNTLHEPADSYIMSRSFKRRLKKGFIPYWNRAIDFFVWSNYYNQLLQFFNLSFDSFGTTSTMVQSRFNYLQRHFPRGMSLSESRGQLVLIELLRSGIILQRDLDNMKDLDLGIEARLDIIKRVEKGLGLFIYDNDLELLVKNPRAFDSFLLAIAGQNNLMNKSHSLPDWSYPEETKFIIPQF